MEVLGKHQVTNIIARNNYKRHTCHTCNKHYPNQSLMLEDHPNIDEIELTVYDKRTGKTTKQNLRVSVQDIPPKITVHNHPENEIYGRITH